VSQSKRWQLCFVVLSCVSLVVVHATQTPVTAPPAPLHVLKIASGPAGAEAKGAFTLSEERSVFSRSDDREVVVFFQWDGVPGPHKLVAQWRSPDGGLTSSSTIDYVAKDRRFGAYWRLTLSPSMPLGTWSIEATVDGQPAGRLTFDVKDEKIATPVIKRPLTQAELYERLNRVFVVIERSTAGGRQLEAAGGFMSGAEWIYTSMATLDGADTLNAVGPDGSRHGLTSVVALHRRQDWAVLERGPLQEVDLPAAAADGIRIGDRFFSIEGGTAGGRALTEGSLTGQSDAPTTGRRFLATFLNGSGTPGAPVLNEFGELVGLIGGADVPGATRLTELLRHRAEMKGIPVVPLNLVRFRPGAPTESVAALQQRGDLVAPLVGEEHVVSGGFARDIVKGPTVTPADQREQFSSQDKAFVVFVNWNPRERVRGQSMLRVFDADNRVIMESKPAKLNVRKGQWTMSTWQLRVPPNAGYYRVDAMIDGKPIWRGFVRIGP